MKKEVSENALFIQRKQGIQQPLTSSPYFQSYPFYCNCSVSCVQLSCRITFSFRFLWYCSKENRSCRRRTTTNLTLFGKEKKNFPPFFIICFHPVIGIFYRRRIGFWFIFLLLFLWDRTLWNQWWFLFREILQDEWKCSAQRKYSKLRGGNT